MRIIIASDFYPPHINGVSTFAHNLAQGLAARKHHVLVIAPSQTGKASMEKHGTYQILRTRSVIFPFYQNIRISVSPTSEVRRAILTFKPNVIHTQTPLGIGLAARRLGLKYNIPVVTTNHGMSENIIENFRLLEPFSRQISYILTEACERLYSNVDYLTMPTQAAIEMFDRDGETTVPIRAVSNGIDLARFSPQKRDPELAKRFGIPERHPIVLYAGRLDGEKHLSVLVRAVWLVRKSVHNVHLLVVGHGNDLNNLRLLVHELGMNQHVTFTGRVSDEDLPKLYNYGDVLGMPSPAELQSIVTLEAMASGLPVVAVNAGALYELCQDGRNGYLCEVDNDIDMSKKLITVLKDQQLRKKMARESLQIAKSHDFAHTIEQFESIYQEVCQEKKL
jgi:glycosyltransferase involved in cell wall biosynthesis